MHFYQITCVWLKTTWLNAEIIRGNTTACLNMSFKKDFSLKAIVEFLSFFFF